MNEMIRDARKIPLCASTIGSARFSHDFLGSGSMWWRGGGYSGVTPIGTKGEVTSAPNADLEALPFLPAPFPPAPFDTVVTWRASPRGTRRARGSIAPAP